MGLILTTKTLLNDVFPNGTLRVLHDPKPKQADSWSEDPWSAPVELDPSEINILLGSHTISARSRAEGVKLHWLQNRPLGIHNPKTSKPLHGVVEKDSLVATSEGDVAGWLSWVWQALVDETIENFGKYTSESNFLPREEMYLVLREVACLRACGLSEIDVAGLLKPTFPWQPSQKGYGSLFVRDAENVAQREQAVLAMKVHDNGNMSYGAKFNLAGHHHLVSDKLIKFKVENVPGPSDLEDKYRVVNTMFTIEVLKILFEWAKNGALLYPPRAF